MTEEEARLWIAERFGSSGVQKMERLVSLVLAESARQNLIAASTVDSVWARHIVDSAQLLAIADPYPGTWLDIGSGAGFPGLVVAALSDRRLALVEPRRKRADFLSAAADALGLAWQAAIFPVKVETLQHSSFAVISARAVAPLGTLVASAHRLSTKDTLWLLPKGRGAREEVAEVQRTWHGSFHVEHSVTDEHSLIVVASRITRR